jgi:pantoate--beta-alanine ligase
VVAKLFNIAAPDVAYFGQKDAQQALVIRRMARDLEMPVRIEICPTVRASDGLALSSRNVNLSSTDRARATALPRSLAALRRVITAGERDASAARLAALAELETSGLQPEYLELVSPDELAPMACIDGDVLALVAARLGETRLIDNELIHAPSPVDRAGHDENGRS